MIEEILNAIVVNDLQPLSAILTRVGGLVRVQRETGVNGGAEKRYPVVNKLPQDCEAGDYSDMSPNSKEVAILYFQAISKPSTVEVLSGVFREDWSLRVVCWFNSEKVDATASRLAANIAARIKRRQPNIGNYLTCITTKFTGFDAKSADIFSAFTYNEAKSQYLMKPYDFFSFTIEVGYLFTPSCVPTTNLVSNDCA